MKTIEEEIKQRKFANIYIKTDVNLMYTSGWLQNNYARFFKTYGISQQQFNVLRILRGQHPNAVMLSQITERMIDKMSNATRLVEKLRQKALVTRQLNDKSRRKVDINITEAGLRLLEEIDAVMNEQIPPAHFSKLTNEELESLNTILDKIRN
ncbi:MAG: MarR family transcriptional regulator [Bacteroidota bacterium]|nr:MarR family transcriptional regulator [Bacteroidota bacterium]